MKNLMMIAYVSLTVAAGALTPTAFADTNSDAIKNIVEARVNDKCMCAGTPEACCKVCPKTCRHLKSMGLMMSRDEEGGPLKVVPFTPAP